MTPCECPGPGQCPRHNQRVTATGWRVCRAGDPRSIENYFKGPKEAVGAPDPPVRNGLGCAWLGAAMVGEDGRQATRRCGGCRGAVYLKLWRCGHPGHAADPTTTEKQCRACGDYQEAVVEVGPELPAVKTVGSNQEMNHWRGG